MRAAFMSSQFGVTTHPEDMRLDANLELGDFGSRRRR
jgi:hypothetical protein